MSSSSPWTALPAGTTLMEASAGTGKTFQITLLVLRLLLWNRLTIDQVLVVTFTEAATSELRDRIRTRLRDTSLALRARVDDPEHRTGDPLTDGLTDQLVAEERLKEALSTLEEALRAFDEAAISTIHGFCRRVLQEHAFESGVDFDTELSTDLSELIDEVVRDFHTLRLHDASEALVRRLGQLKVDLKSLKGLARAVADDPSMPVLATLSDDSEDTPDNDALASLRDAMERARLSLEPEALAEVLSVDVLNKGTHAPEKVATYLAQAAAWLHNDDPLLDLSGDPKGTRYLRADVVETKTKKARPVPTHPFLDAWQGVWEAQEALFADLDVEVLSLRLALVDYVRAELPRRKARLHVQGFSDLLNGLRDALVDPDTGPRLARRLRATFQAALIDEFQDTDPVQLQIFRTVFARPEGTPAEAWEHVLTVIGDPKQAIYGFRGADIHAYLSAHQFTDATASMATNWRTDAPLVAALNHLWGRLGSPFLQEGIDYVQVDAAHTDPRFTPGELPAAPLQVLFLPRDDELLEVSGKHKRIIKKSWSNIAIPHIIAGQVAKALTAGAQVQDRHTGAWRAVRPGDCAVIVRKNKQAADMQQALRALGIPSVLHAAASVFQSPEARELSLVLAAAAEPTDAGAIRSALATSLLGLQAHQLATLQQDETGWEQWVARFRDWQEAWQEHGFMRMFRALLVELDLPAALMQRPGGERTLTNLLHLAEQLHQASLDQELGPLGLRRWFHRELEDEQGDSEARQQRLESDGDAVELVTTHRAKGLEYGLVWCPFLFDPASQHPAEDDGFAVHDPDRGHRRVFALGPEDRDAWKPARLAEIQAEDLRLLYVALTRARHRLTVVFGGFRGIGTSALGHLFAGPPPGADPTCADRTEGLDDDEILSELRDLAAATAGAMAVQTWAPEPPVRPTLPEDDPAALAPAVFTRRQTLLDYRWRRSSFSAMVRGATQVHHEEHIDHDALRPGEAAAEPARHGPPVRLATFPAGAGPGTFFHEVLEHLDFQAPRSDLAHAQIAEKLVEHGLPTDPWATELPPAIEDILTTPLGHGLGSFCLAELTPRERLDELEFLIAVAGGTQPEDPAANLSAAGLSRAFAAAASDKVPAAYAGDLARLPFLPVQGFLTGSIDLVFTVGGRWYVVDYKTNKLGEGRDDYDQAGMTEVMRHHNYFLQYHLYTVALHRFLRWRLPDYDPATHLGGSFYLFLRGMSPETGPDRGVFFDRPSPRLVALLEAELAQGGSNS